MRWCCVTGTMTWCCVTDTMAWYCVTNTMAWCCVTDATAHYKIHCTGLQMATKMVTNAPTFFILQPFLSPSVAIVTVPEESMFPSESWYTNVMPQFCICTCLIFKSVLKQCRVQCCKMSYIDIGICFQLASLFMKYFSGNNRLSQWFPKFSCQVPLWQRKINGVILMRQRPAIRIWISALSFAKEGECHNQISWTNSKDELGAASVYSSSKHVS